MHAADVMARDLHTVVGRTTVAEAIRLMHATGNGALPVVDEEGSVLGMIDDAAIMGRCLPEYVKEVGDLYGTGDFAPFDERVRGLAAALVQEVMRTDVPTAEEDTPLAEVATLMMTHSVRHVPIVRGGRLVGMVEVQHVIDSIVGRASKDNAAS